MRKQGTENKRIIRIPESAGIAAVYEAVRQKFNTVGKVITLVAQGSRWEQRSLTDSLTDFNYWLPYDDESSDSSNYSDESPRSPKRCRGCLSRFVKSLHEHLVAGTPVAAARPSSSSTGTARPEGYVSRRSSSYLAALPPAPVQGMRACIGVMSLEVGGPPVRWCRGRGAETQAARAEE